MKTPAYSGVFARTRRWLLIGLSAAGMTASWPYRWGRITDESIDSRLLKHFFPCEPALAARIGTLYLEAVPRERSQQRLAEMVLGVRRPESTFDPATMVAHVRARRDRDYLDGDLVAINGWLLTRTEARLCALASLSASS